MLLVGLLLFCFVFFNLNISVIFETYEHIAGEVIWYYLAKEICAVKLNLVVLFYYFLVLEGGR